MIEEEATKHEEISEQTEENKIVEDLQPDEPKENNVDAPTEDHTTVIFALSTFSITRHRRKKRVTKMNQRKKKKKTVVIRMIKVKKKRKKIIKMTTTVIRKKMKIVMTRTKKMR